MLAIFFRDWHPLDIGKTAVVSPLEVASNFWMGDTRSLFEILNPDCFLFKIQVNIFLMQIHLHSFSVRFWNFHLFLNLNSSGSQWFKLLPATALPEMLFTLKPVIFAILLWILQLELRSQGFGNTPVCVWGNPGCNITQTSLFYRQPSISLEQPSVSASSFSWNPLLLARTMVCYSCDSSAEPWLAGGGNYFWSEQVQGTLWFLAM